MNSDNRLVITTPHDGDILNSRDGKWQNGRFWITVRGKVRSKSRVYVNGRRAEKTREGFRARVPLFFQENLITAVTGDGALKDRITVLWDQKSVKRYRFSVDDNIWFLRDIAHSRGSIFENRFLAMWKKMHERYGAKIHFNIYYRDRDFTLKDMPADHKSEWIENSDWLRLTFHALQDKPDRPYTDAGYKEVLRDCRMVTDEIVRFAGEELLSPFTTVHWGEATREGCRALRDFGFRGLSAYFNIENGRPVISYYHDLETVKQINRRGYWHDTSEGLTFFKNDLVLNTLAHDEIIPRLHDEEQTIASDLIEVMIHEQYFYKDYAAYQPNYEEKVETAIRWLAEHNYQSILFDEGFLGSPQ